MDYFRNEIMPLKFQQIKNVLKGNSNLLILIIIDNFVKDNKKNNNKKNRKKLIKNRAKTFNILVIIEELKIKELNYKKYIYR